MQPAKSKHTREDQNWKIWVDTGGTFTDCLAVDNKERLHRVKLLSNSALRGSIDEVISPREIRVREGWGVPSDFICGFQFCLLETSHRKLTVEAYDHTQSTIVVDKPLPPKTPDGAAFEVRSFEEAPVLAARLATGTPAKLPLPKMSMRLGSTRGTNALLQRRGAPTAFFVTEGFADLLVIRNQQRPELFALDICKPEPFYDAVVEVPERIVAGGGVLTPLELDGLRADVSRLLDTGIHCAAVALMHSYANPSHEHTLAKFLLGEGFRHVSCSSDLAPFIKLLPRAETAVVDAYLAPIIDDYLDRIQAPLGSRRLHVMTSAGGMMQPGSYHAKDSLLSGPAGGVVGAVLAGRRSGFSQIIAFDMGGTSTDVSRFDGDYDYTFEHEVGDAHLVAPALAIESVAAGGGSICRFDGVELHVGPESAGADPGPACYGAGGPLTLTDVNLLLGRLEGKRFDIPINPDLAKSAFDDLHRSIEKKKNQTIARESLLEGLRHIANERMADAIRRISIRKGYDPKEYALVAFGGAGGQHACAVAEHLGIDTIVVPEDASLLSALGLGHAAIERLAERQVLRRLDEIRARIPEWIDELAKEAVTELEREGFAKNDIEIRRTIISMRFTGQDSGLQVEFDSASSIDMDFRSKYEKVFGYYPKDRPIEIESIRIVASSRLENDIPRISKTHPTRVTPSRKLDAWFDGGWRPIPVFERDDIPPGTEICGPALVFERYSVTAVENDWMLRMDDSRALVLQKTQTGESTIKTAHPEVIRLELFTNRFTTIAKEMGEMLRRTAISTNVKERMDFSCALLDADGELVVNAPHIPVHLGAIGMCVRGVREAGPMEPGDVVVTNHPKYGGSHLPDVTVVSPVHLPDGQLLGYVANRAHHAEIGGAQPGSMPSTASTLAEEGVVIPPTHVFKNGRACWDDLERLLAEAPHPSRAIDENLADLRAAVAANRKGGAALLKLAEDHGKDTVRHYMTALKEWAASKIRAALQKVPDGTYEATERLDDGSVLRVKIDIAGDHAHADFSGSAGVSPGNLNATPAVVTSVVIYVLRLLVKETLPLNEGLMHAITLNVPRGLLNPPFHDDPTRAPAVVGGNVETSQRLVDCLLKALELAACSQGTMNNVSFGTDRFSYYETVCGGAGAGPDFDGASAVHTHMTNTRITDPEILEHRYPIRLERFAIRRGSGGDGAYRGGDGAVREMTFLDRMSLSVLGQHRVIGPYGLRGGDAGKQAVQRLVRANGETVKLGSIDGCEVGPGDRFILETPGGGGYGEKKSDDSG
ncbi:MAG: hydantoinase B/oxoprolinase family protein [Candidatus Latescibacterota bacterium]|nr:MAG: hydantoinase B/oxoprolinase family protein [Candidatus Latescibacterota bacterium]